jgi:hypothetical protein
MCSVEQTHIYWCIAVYTRKKYHGQKQQFEGVNYTEIIIFLKVHNLILQYKKKPHTHTHIQCIQYILLYALFNSVSFHQIPVTVNSGTSVTHKTPDNKLCSVFEKS